jgi:hypothetical protein
MSRKTIARNMLLSASLLSLTLIADAQLVPNGGFEDDLTGWTVYKSSDGAATFAITETESDVHTGSKSLEVTVSDPDSVVLTQPTVPLGSDSIYIMRFRAISDLRGALLDVIIRGENTDTYCKFKIYDRFNPNNSDWQMYDYCFKSKDDVLAVDLVFKSSASYLIDNVEIIGNSTSVLDLDMQILWQNNRSGYGWASSDNDASVPLPDGRIAWIFSDTFLGWPDPNSNYLDESTMVNNIIVVQEGENMDSLRSVYKGTQSSPTHLFKPTSGLYWITDGIIENGKLIIVLNRWDRENGSLEYQGEAGVGTISLPDLTVESLITPAYSSTDIPNAILEDDDYNYIYTVERVGGIETYTRVARVEKGQLNNPDVKWEFFTKYGTWVPDNSQAKRILSGVEAGSVLKLGPGNYVMSGVPKLSKQFAVWFAPSPIGPWGHKTVLYVRPGEEGVLSYFGHLHEGTERDGGVFTLSYSIYPFDGRVPQQLADRGIYIPRFIEANIRDLSPYRDADCMGVTGGTAYVDECGECVGGTSGKFPCFPGADENLALDKPVSASSQNNDFPAGLSTDGDYATYWESAGTGDEWIQVNLEDTIVVKGIRLVWESAFAKDLEIKCSLDNETWETISTKDDDDAEILDIIDIAFQAKYIQVHLVSSGSGNPYRLEEIEVYGEEFSLAVDITDVGGIISVEHMDSPIGEEFYRLVDNNLLTKYLTFHSSGWVRYNADTSYILESYSITSAGAPAERDPESWTLEASADGNTWKTIDSRDGIVFPERNQRQEFKVSDNGVYSSFRFNLNNVSGDILQLAEIELFGIPSAPTTSVKPGEYSSVSIGNSFIAYPNPFRDQVEMEIFLEKEGATRFSLYNYSGQLINQHELYLHQGWNSVNWQGIVAEGQQGIYFLKATVNEQPYPVIKLCRTGS